MKIEFLFFFWLIVPYLKWLVNWFLGRTEDVLKAKQEKRKKRSAEVTTLIGGIVMVVASVPYFGAYYYAELRYLWVFIGGFYLVMGLFNLLVVLILKLGTKFAGEEMEQHKEQSRSKYKNVKFWPNWQVRALCIYQYCILGLWLFSWRGLIGL